MRSPQAGLLGCALIAWVSSGAALAKDGPAHGTLPAAHAEAIAEAIDEGRLLDAGVLIDRGRASAAGDPRLALFSGRLGLARGEFKMSLEDFKVAEAQSGDQPRLRAQALEGEGLAMIASGQSEAAMPPLEEATKLAPDAWRAWDALGALHDSKREWPQAELAYAQAISVSPQNPIILNNRGYSRLLQGRASEAQSDFVAALTKRPDLAAARTNLRLAMALQGEYASAVGGGKPGEQAALLNNAGFAAGARGDFVKARELLEEAMKTRGEFYGRASENLRLFQSADANASPP